MASKGATPLVVASNHSILGVIELSDVIKQGIKERFALLREMGIKTIMVTGDNPLTAAAIAAFASGAGAPPTALASCATPVYVPVGV